MATDLNNSIQSTGGFIPSTKDTPLDIRSRVDTKNDILNILNPYVGLMVYVVDESKRYEIISIKEVQEGLSTVNKVDQYREVTSGSGGDIPKEYIRDVVDEYIEENKESLKGKDGDPGPKGDPGSNGKSAYEIAVENGFAGTEQDWLESLEGSSGKSAYELAVLDGFIGTEGEWLESLNGANGMSAYELAVAGGFEGTEQQWLESLKGRDGKTPEKGVDYWTESEVSDMKSYCKDYIDTELLGGAS